VDKLSEIFQKQDIKSISVVHMEVPCLLRYRDYSPKGTGKAQKKHNN